MYYEIIHQPFMFIETLELLYKFINGLNFSDMWNPNHESSNSPRENAIRERLTILQQIMDEVCQELNAEDPRLRYFFVVQDATHPNQASCLARYLVNAFMEYRSPGFDETAADILRNWEKMNAAGGWLRRAKGVGLQWGCEPGCPGDLFAQVCALTDLSADFRLQLYGALHRFPEALKELTELMRPVSVRLEVAFANSGMCLSDMLEYWLHSQMPPLDFLAESMGSSAVANAGSHTRLAVGLMSANQIFYAMAHEGGRNREYNYMCIGCCISTYSLRFSNSHALDEASAILRGLSERKRLEILRRLSKRSCYGLELAEVMNMDRGNLSRLLSALHNQGFLVQEKENQRVYYRASREALKNFFDRLVSDIFD